MTIFKTITRLLSFQLSKAEMLQFESKHLVVGIIGTWVVGMGRYWDEKNSSFLQNLGLGSVIYIFLLAAFIWIILKPFFIKELSYFTVLTFISLTSFPAIFYAIPVERFFLVSTANSMNAWFLGIVAIWRFCLLYSFLKKFTQLSVSNIFTVTFMPICLIISVLTALNLHRVVFNIMSGIRNPSPHDSSYLILNFLTVISALLTPFLLIA
jgi:Yip1 domain